MKKIASPETTMIATLLAAAIAIVAILYINEKVTLAGCVRSHTETYTSYVLINKVMMPVEGTRTVCDEYKTN